MISFGELRDNVDALPEQEQDKLAAYLTMLRKAREPGYDEELSDRLAEDPSAEWVRHHPKSDS